MGRRLRGEEPCFRDVLEQCDEAVRRHLGWSVFEEIDAPEERSSLNRLDVTQAAVFSMQVALAELWKSWGIEPAAVVGHSLGEYAAAHVAGALTLDDALRAMCARSRLIESLAGRGRMLAVGVGGKDAHAAIAGYEESVSVAVLNSPTSTVLSGDPDALEAIKTRFDEHDVFARWVATNIASHSPQVDAITPRLEQDLQDLETRSERVPIYSTVTGGPLPGTEFGGSYWARNLRECVRFGPVIEDLLAAGHHTFIEVSPHPVLQVPVQQTAEHVGREATALPSMRRDEGDRAVPLESLGALYTMGYPVDWTKLYPDGGRVTSLPSYPCPRERFSVADESVGPDLLVNSDHPFLRYRWESAQHPGTFHWEVELDSKSFPYVTEHRIQGVPLYPGAGFLELALAAVREVYGEGRCVFHDVEFKKVLSFREDEVKRLQLVVAPLRSDRVSFKLYDRRQVSENAANAWTLLAGGSIETDPKLPDTAPSVQFSAESLDADSLEKLDSTQFYERAADINAQLGPTFQGVREAWYFGSSEKAVCRLQVPDVALRQAVGHSIHPGFLDTIFHTYWIFRIMSPDGGQQALPVGIRRLEIHQLPDPESELWSQSWLSDPDTPDGTREGHIEVFDRRGKLLLRESGHISKKIEKAVENNGDRDVNEWLYTIGWENQALPEGSAAGQTGAFLILADRQGLGTRMRSALESRRIQCNLVEFEGDEPWSVADFEQVVERFRTASRGPYHVVYLAALDAPANSEISLEYLTSEPKRICGGALHLLQAVGKQAWEAPCRLWCVTRGAQSLRDGHEAPSVAQAPLLGLGRVMAAEYPNFQVSRVDLDPAEPTDEVEALLQEISAQSEHQVVAWRQGQRNVASMSRLSERNEGLVTRKRITISDQSEDSYRLETSGIGILDNLTLLHCPRRQPEPGEVEVRIVAAGLNFLDVLRSLGMFPGPQPKSLGFGMECSGRIVSCGEGVTHLDVDDEVIVIRAGFTGLFRAFVTTSATHVFRKPEHLTFEEAATIPVVYQTAYYSFVHLARLQKGESVLIHSAAGGVGLAAVELAKQIGAVVFATAGSEEKREYLKSLGVEHVMNSRTLDFAEEILTYTQGRGVDVVLNSLAGEAIAKSLSVLATGGRFVEIGKRDIYDDTQLGLLPFQKNLSFFAVDLMRLSQERPEVVSSLTGEVIERIHDGTFKALPYRTFRADEAVEAFHFMAQGKHTGKVILKLDLPEVEVEMAAEQPIQVRSDATYLITGGLGGLGLVFARSLVEKGARHLALVGRRGATPDSQPEIAAMEQMGAEVWTAAADVSSPADMDSVLAEIRKSMPPIKGVIHGAGILNDTLLESLDWPNFEQVLPSKIAGGWILHTRLLDDDLDFFAMFSSAASLIGGPGQGNYPAANAFLDGLVGYRRAQGLPAVSFNWGPWAEVGLAARLAEQGKLTASKRLDSIRPTEGVKIFDYRLARNDAQLIAMPINWKQRAERDPGVAEDTIVIPFGRESVKHAHRETEATVLAAVREATDRQEAQQVIEEFLKDQISSVLKIPRDRIDRQIGIDRLGLDSLMAMELKVRVESTLPVTLAVVKLLQGPSLIELSESLSADLASNDLGAKAPEPIVSLSDRASLDVDQMSDDEVDASLVQLFAEQSATDG